MLSQEELQAGMYFWGLQHYQPLWNRHGIPALLLSKDWHKPFTCFCLANVVTLAVIVLIYRSDWKEGRLFIFTSLAVLIVFNFTYLLAQFANPGIVYAKNQQAVPAGQPIVSCSRCGTFSAKGTATHCYECGVCVMDLDHHCGWLGRCIGSYNRYFFHAFLLCTLGILLNFLVTAVYALDQN